MDSIKIFAPNTVANVGCGYDVLGFAVESYGDEVTVSRRSDDQLTISGIDGANLPMDPTKNVATVAIQSLLTSLDSTQGFDVHIRKSIPPGSGLGSSACSSAGAVFGANELLGRPFSRNELVRFAMEGERESSGAAHADNVAPSLLGGFTAVRSYDPLDVFNIPFPQDLLAVIIYPDVKVNTADAKKMLKNEVHMLTAIGQLGNMAGLVSGLMQNDFERIGASMTDFIAEPVRKTLIPGYDKLKETAMKNGALGYTISGSGPTSFAFTNDPETAQNIRKACSEIYQDRQISVLSFVSGINPIGCQII